MPLRPVALRGSAPTGGALPRRPISLSARPAVVAAPDLPVATAPATGDAASYWGPRFLLGVVAIIALTAVLGIKLGFALLTIAAVGVSVLGRLHPVVGALGVTCLCIADPLAADFLSNPVDGNMLAVVTGGLWRYNTVAYVLAFGAFTSLPALQRTLVWVPVRWAAGLIATIVLWLAVSRDLVTGSQIALDFVALFGLLAYFLRVADDAETWYWVGLVGGTLGALGMPLYFAGMGGLPYTNPNVVVFVPVAALFAAWLGFVTCGHNAARQIQLGALAAANLLWAFLSTSRGGLITASICALFVLLAVRSTRRRIMLVVSAALIAAVAFSSFTKLQESAVERLELLFDSSVSSRLRTSGRDELAQGAWQMFKENPLGVGTGSFETSWSELGAVNGQRAFMRSGQRFAAHAGWLRVLAENGIVGILTLATFILSFAWAGVKAGPGERRLLGFSVTLALATALVSTEFHLKAQFFLAAGATALLYGSWTSAVPMSNRPARRLPTLTVRPSPMEVH